MTWASGIGADGRPVKLPNQEPTANGTRVCPSQDGATNWYSPSFNPLTGMFYFQTNEKCSIYYKRDQGEWQAGKSYLGGSQSGARRSEAAAHSEGHRLPDRRDEMGDCRSRAGD